MGINIYFLINALALGIATLGSILFLMGIVNWRDKTTGGRMILMTVAAITFWIGLPFGELFIRNQWYSFSIGVFGVIMVVGLLLIAMSVPNKRFSWIHWSVLATIIPLALTIFIPGVVYEDMIPQPEGYTILVPGPYFDLHEGIIIPIYLIAPIFVYMYRYIREKDYKTKVFLRILGIGHTISITIFLGTIIALPGFGYSQFVNIGTAFAMVFVMSAITYAYVRYVGKRDKYT